jgi:hypothetical protein
VKPFTVGATCPFDLRPPRFPARISRALASALSICSIGVSVRGASQQPGSDAAVAKNRTIVGSVNKVSADKHGSRRIVLRRTKFLA